MTPTGVVVSKWESYTGTPLLPRDVASLLVAAKCPLQLLEPLVAVACWESGIEGSDGFFYCWSDAKFENPGHDPITSEDLGILQFNSVQQPTAFATAADPAKACASAVLLAKPDGSGLAFWNSWKNFLAPAAFAALPPAQKAKATQTWRRAILGCANARCLARKVPTLSGVVV